MLNTVCVSNKTVCPVSLLLLSSVDRLSGLAHVLAGSQEQDVRPRGKRGMCCEVEYVCRKSWSLVKAKLLLGVVAPYFLFLGVCLFMPRAVLLPAPCPHQKPESDKLGIRSQTCFKPC